MLLPAFNPANPDTILDALADPTQSLLQVARENNISIRALSTWLQSDDVRPHAELIDKALTNRARTQAAAAFPAIIAAATRTIESFNKLERPAQPDKPDQADRYQRHCTSTLRAGSLLLRIARFDPSPRRHAEPRRAETSSDTLATLAAILGVPRNAPHGIPTTPALTPREPDSASLPASTTPSNKPAAPPQPERLKASSRRWSAAASAPEQHPRHPHAQSSTLKGCNNPAPSIGPFEPAVEPLQSSSLTSPRHARRSRAATLSGAAGLASGP